MCIACDFDGGKSVEFLTKNGSLGRETSRPYFFIGVEIEKEYTGRDNDETVAKVSPISDRFFSNSGDGSLDDGVEFQSMPATFNHYRKLYTEGYFDELFNAFDEGGLESHSNAGSHVHISRAALSLQTRRKMCKMMHSIFTNRFLTVLSRRTVPNTWARRTDRWDDVAHGWDDEKYYVLNYGDYRPTMEFRIWSSPQTAEELMEQIEFVTALKEYVRRRNIDRMSQFGFRKYVRENIGRYPNLAERLTRFEPRTN